MMLINFIAAYFLLIAISAVIALAGQIFLSFIIAEDAFLKGSRHPVRWGLFTFFFTWLAIAIYYLTWHHQFESQAFDSLSFMRFMRQIMKADKIRLKIILWILGISAAIFVATIMIILSLTILLAS